MEFSCSPWSQQIIIPSTIRVSPSFAVLPQNNINLTLLQGIELVIAPGFNKPEVTGLNGNGVNVINSPLSVAHIDLHTVHVEENQDVSVRDEEEEDEEGAEGEDEDDEEDEEEESRYEGNTGAEECVDQDTQNNEQEEVSKEQGAENLKSLQRIRYCKEEYHCQQCPYTCTTEKAFLRHVRLCEPKAIEPDSSKNHPVSCPVCGKDKANKEILSVHMKVHRKDKYFCCDKCTKFKTLQLKKLIQHRRMHTGEKPHLCPWCIYRSSRRDNLRSHVRRVHKKSNFSSNTFNPRSMVLIPSK